MIQLSTIVEWRDLLKCGGNRMEKRKERWESSSHKAKGEGGDVPLRAVDTRAARISHIAPMSPSMEPDRATARHELAFMPSAGSSRTANKKKKEEGKNASAQCVDPSSTCHGV